MKIALDDIKAAPKELAYSEEVDELNARLDRGAHDYRVPRGLEVRVEFYRSGLDVFFNGALHGQVIGTCARCLEEYPFDLDHPFVFVLEPRAVAPSESARLSAEDLALSYYEGDRIDLTPLVRGGLPGSLRAVRREPERRRLRLPRRAARPAPRGPAGAAREVTRGRGGLSHGGTQAPHLGEQT